ncbi:type I polyketide synthase [Chondromyces crocatus]|uniref:Polyketide synthase n=1 Tax=Chondromyces crocatus TaxID=52 RepID=A0A0K1EIL2_CHOCO|nr:type I polyketide synthase [Chondromyces crocatus]AKT40701.1 uncharacterized protein CMC5_048570 [Chondromyces crocatus]
MKLRPSEVSSLVDLLRWRAEHQPSTRAFTLLQEDGETEDGHLTYAEIDAAARSIAAQLQSLGFEGKRVVLLFPASLGFVTAFFGCLYAGAIAIPAPPPSPSRIARTLPRLTGIVEDARPVAVLTDRAGLALSPSLIEASPALGELRWLAVEEASAHADGRWRCPEPGRGSVAYVQYTSGSTTAPKGTLISHGNLLAISEAVREAKSYDEDSRAVIWVPNYHDDGLIHGILQPIYTGYPCVLMHPGTLVARPAQWLMAITRYRATHAGGPNFAYELCLRKVTDAQRERLDLSSWRMAYNAAEPIRMETLQGFHERFAPCGFRWETHAPCYGLAEASLTVSAPRGQKGPRTLSVDAAALAQRGEVVEVPSEHRTGRTVVGCGRPVLGARIAIVQPSTATECPPRTVGEIWLASDCVALGYLDRPEATQETFHAHLADTGEGPFLRTGDLGFLADGELFITGRVKDLIIIRGENRYPQDIEWSVQQAHGAVRPGGVAAFSIDVGDEERLGLVVETALARTGKNGAPGATQEQRDEVFGAIRQAVAERHDLQVHAIALLPAGTIPKTSSGKIQRRACKDGFTAGALDEVARWTSPIPATTPARARDGAGERPRSPAASALSPTTPALSKSYDATRAWLIDHLATRLGVSPASIDIRAPFARFGLDSAAGVAIAAELGDWLGRALPPTSAWDHPSIHALSLHLAGDDAPPRAVTTPLHERAVDEPIAVIGMACRFPRAADRPEAYWQLLLDGVDAVGEVPKSRFDIDACFDPTPGVRGKTYARQGAFLDEVATFDAGFFGVSPREATDMDPQQRLLLEVCWEALERAGQVVGGGDGVEGAVFVGVSTDDYADAHMRSGDPARIGPHAFTGVATSITAGRLSYALGLTGPSVAIDTACSSSLVAVHLACQSLQAGECRFALAAGVNLILSPQNLIALSQLRALSPTGRLRAFDAAADGYVRGEGCGVVVLKRLSHALADGDPILAVLRGTAINQDGTSNGLTAPSAAAQEAVIRKALDRAGISPREVTYVEAHGTGTPLGDPIEITALGAVYGEDRPADVPLWVGTAKTNIGHLESAAGIAGLMKVVLSLQHGEIPPNRHFDVPSPFIPWERVPARVPTQRIPWERGQGRRVGAVSSFGMSGTNAHVVLEEAPLREVTASRDVRLPALLPLSARSDAALLALAKLYEGQLDSLGDAPEALQALVSTAALRRAHHDHRMAVVGRDPKELAAALGAFTDGQAHAGLVSAQVAPRGRPRVAFVFPGYGGQWVGMGRQLLAEEPVFAAAIAACEAALSEHVDWSLSAVLRGDADTPPLERTDVVQPVLFGVGVSLAALWASWGVTPDAVVGHSLGEIAAAHVAGVLSLRDAAQVVCHRSRLMHRISGQGTIGVVELPQEEVAKRLQGREHLLSVAVVNNPQTTGISGDPAALDALLSSLEAEGVFCRRVKIDVASHSPQVEPLLPELREALKELSPQAEQCPIYSTVMGGVQEGGAFSAGYWARNVREPVQFARAVQQLLDDGHTLFVEVGPHPVLLPAMEPMLRQAGDDVAAGVASLRRGQDERAALLLSLGQLHVRGYPVRFEGLYPEGSPCASLPTYPFQRERFWLDRAPLVRASAGWSHGESDHPLLGDTFRPSTQPGMHFWQTELRLPAIAWLADHRILDAIVLPASAYVDMALAAVERAIGPGVHPLDTLTFHEALTLHEDQPRTVQVALAEEGQGTLSLRISSLAPQAVDQAWTLHVSATVQRAAGEAEATPAPLSLAALQAQCPGALEVAQHYEALREQGLQYGPTFQRIQQLWQGDREALARLQPVEGNELHAVHPALLDAAFQTLSAAMPAARHRGPVMPVGLQQFRLFQRPGAEVWCHVRLRDLPADARAVEGDVLLLDGDGQVIAEALGLRVQLLEAPRRAEEDLFLSLHWQPALAPVLADPPSPGRLLVLADRSGTAQALLAALAEHGIPALAAVPHGVEFPTGVETVAFDPERSDGLDAVLERAFAEGIPCRGVVHLLSLDATPPEATTAASLERDETVLCGSVIHLVQALDRRTSRNPPRLWLVTRGVHRVVPSDERVAPAQAPLWGLARTLAYEHPELDCTRIDLGAQPAPDEVHALVQELSTATRDEEEIALRSDGRFAARLLRRAETPREVPASALASAGDAVNPALRADGSYLITGGLGGLGLSIARWMVDQGARHLVLLGRSGATTPEQHAALAALAEAGASVRVAQADVQDATQLGQLLDDLRATLPPLRGIVHAAGVLDDALLLQQDVAKLRKVMAPKVAGAWNLHALTRETALDFFVLYSSGAALLGSPGQANYAAANAFLDALAHHRRALGLPAISIGWGSFSEAGMAAAQASRGTRLAQRGLRSLTPAEGVAILGRLLGASDAQLGAVPIDLRQWIEFYPQAASSPLLSELARGVTRGRRAATQRGTAREALRAVAPAARRAALERFVRDEVAHVLQLDPARIAWRAPFKNLGVDSLTGLELRNRLEAGLGLTLSATLIWTYASVAALAEHLLEQLLPTLEVTPRVAPSTVVTSARAALAEARPGAPARVSLPGAPDATRAPEGTPHDAQLQQALATIDALQDELAAQESLATEPIAIIGMSCRLPGGGTDPEAFWQVLERGVDGVREIPVERWPVGAPDKDLPGTRWGGFLDQVDTFDAAFFGIAPREAQSLDPQQRLLLEVAWEALEHAGQPADRLVGSRTGVFIGMMTLDYQRRVTARGVSHLDAYSATGTATCFAPGRLAYVLGLEGPTLAVDTACSSSLVAVHLACQSLRKGESQMALAGGVNVMLSRTTMYLVAKTQAVSPDGRCKAFDASANGFVRGEGCGVLVLKRLSDAQRDGDRIIALIRGSAVNQDGRSTGLTTPNVLSQQALLRQSLADARVEPSELGYIEAHGTGTSLGDPIEMEALKAALGAPRADGSTCPIGSVKTNLGHLEAAAGVAGILKVVLSLQHETIPRHLHFKALNPRISLDDTPFYIPTERIPWRRGERRRVAGVSSFGMSGTNAHVVLEEAPAQAVEAAATAVRLPLLLPLSARSPEALTALASLYAAHLGALKDDVSALRDVVYTAGVRRAHHDHRAVAVGRDRAEIAAALIAFTEGRAHPGLSAGRVGPELRPRVAFVFPGYGGQWVGMGRQLLAEEPVFAAAIAACEAALSEHVDWSLSAVLRGDADTPPLERTDVVQPVLFGVGVSLAALWASWGVTPDAVVGHSLGEIAAAHVAGVLSLRDAAQVVCHRSRLMHRISGQGTIGVVELPQEEVAKRLQGREHLLSVAVVNNPQTTGISGDPEALDALLSSLEAEGVFCRRVKIDVASHSPQVEPLLPELREALKGLSPQAEQCPIYSTVTGGVQEGGAFTAGYWARNVREPVQFARAVQQLLDDGHTLFVEVGPHPVLLPAMEPMLRQAGEDVAAGVASVRRGQDERGSLLSGLGGLYARGYPVRFEGLYPEGGQCASLPTYPFQRERFWLDDVSDPEATRDGAPRGGDHPLLGGAFASSTQPGTHFWQAELRTDAPSWLADHRIQEAAVLPGAAYVEMALAAAERTLGAGVHVLDTLTFHEALTLHEGQPTTVQIALTEEGGGGLSVRISSLNPQATARDWTLHASVLVRAATPTAEGAVTPPRTSLEALQGQCATPVEAAHHYEALGAQGLQYGPAFQRVQQLWRGDREALARLQPADPGEPYALHPALLDAAFQTLSAAVSASGPGGPAVPVALERVRLFQRPGAEVWCHARLRDLPADARAVEGDVLLLDGNGQVIAEALGLRVQFLEAPRRTDDDLYLSLHWQPALAPVPAASPTAGRFLVLADRSGTAQALLTALVEQGIPALAVVPRGVAPPAGVEAVESDLSTPAEVDALLERASADGVPCRGIVHLLGLDATSPAATTLASLEHDQAALCGSVLQILQAHARRVTRNPPRLWLVTRGVHRVGASDRDVSIAQAPLWGLARTIAYEHPELDCTRIDLAAQPTPGEADALLQELLASTRDEEEIALRLDGRFAARLQRRAPEASATVDTPTLVPAADLAFRLESDQPGVLDRLALRTTERRPPGPGEVEIRIQAAGMNFRDVLLALGALPNANPDEPLPFGGECAGVVVAVGEGVTHLQPGQEVVAVARGTMGSFVTTPATLVLPKPARLTPEEAATLPIAHLSAYYALAHVARLAPGERILIHAATGGVGLAAVQWARHVGAEIFATASSPEKHAHLRALGVQHISDSRSLRFVQDIQAWTQGEGVDVVLNSLSGDFIPKSLELLRDHGRFIELGMRDYVANAQLGLRPFLRNLSFALVDLMDMSRKRPERVRALFEEMLALVEQGALQPLPHTAFPIAAHGDAFQHMVNARHIGKIVVTLDSPTVPVRPAAHPAFAVRADATYLITGGLGGLGLSLARWLVTSGARHLALLGRSAPTTTAQHDALAELRALGATVLTEAVDVADRGALAATFARIAERMPALRGVIHAAGVLDDRLLTAQDLESFRKVMAPKIAGAWNLHELTKALPLDAFVLYSSAASLLGSPGQGNYAAANAFLDALAHHRRALGLPALSVNWGAFSEVGLAASQDNRGSRLAQRGMRGLSPAEGNDALGHLLAVGGDQLGVLALDVRQWIEFYPQAASSPLLSDLARDATRGKPRGGGRSAVLDALHAAPSEARPGLLEQFLRDQVGQVLQLEPARIERHAPFKGLGIDSLTGLELRNRIEAGLRLTLSATLVWTYPTIATLTEHLGSKIGHGAGTAGAPGAGADAAGRPDVAIEVAADAEGAADDDLMEQNLAGMSDEDFAALVQGELDGQGEEL